MTEEIRSTDELNQLKKALIAAFPEGVLLLQIELDQPPPEHEPGWEELMICMDVRYPNEPVESFLPLKPYQKEIAQLFRLMLSTLRNHHMLTGDTRPSWHPPAKNTLALLLDYGDYPFTLLARLEGNIVQLCLSICCDLDMIH